MGAFFDKVHEVVRRIPRGCVSTYGDVARAVGEPRKARFVGYAMRANPSPGQGEGDIPCHRVVFADGSICEGFAFGGPDVQRALLESESVPFLDELHVDLDKCRWQFTRDALGRPTDIDWAAEMDD
ncbi:MAG: MGMT family protein [Eggerthellaceae bacterium]|nr:MGMT family protein [Eggerthellaceae bacterium]